LVRFPNRLFMENILVTMDFCGGKADDHAGMKEELRTGSCS
jgi:hypothetical protein